MNTRLIVVIVGSSLALGFGTGFGFGVSDQPLIVEFTGTPIGSFTLKCNLSQTPPMHRNLEEHLLWGDNIA